jgi:hypothetical protein
MPPALFALVILEKGSCFLHRSVWTVIVLFYTPAVGGVTGTHHCAQLLIETGDLVNFLHGVASNLSLPKLNLPSRKDYRCKLPVSSFHFIIGQPFFS